jgi:hypothetical protein
VCATGRPTLQSGPVMGIRRGLRGSLEKHTICMLRMK